MAGAGTGPAVLRLTDCSLLVLPRVDPDGRTRYAMLETLRAYAAGLLCQAGEDEAAEAALAGYAAKLAAEAAVRLQAGITEVTSLRQLDAEDATVSRALAWAMDHDPVLCQGSRSPWSTGGRSGVGWPVMRGCRPRPSGTPRPAASNGAARACCLARPPCTLATRLRRWGISPPSATRSKMPGPPRRRGSRWSCRCAWMADRGRCQRWADRRGS